MLLGGKVILANAVPAEQKMMSEVLKRAGFQVVAETNNMSQTFRRARALFCDLVIVDSALEGGKGWKTASVIEEDQLAAVLILVSRDISLQERRFHYLIKPVFAENLIPAVEAALMYWQRQLDLREKIMKLEDRLETRIILDKAKGTLIDTLGISENEAHRFIQKEAMKRGISLKQVASEVLKNHIPDN
jgi:response regulator NasT